MGIFEPFRAIGYITSSVPFSVQRLGTETFVTVSVGKSWQIYNVILDFLLYYAFKLFEGSLLMSGHIDLCLELFNTYTYGTL